MVLLNCNDIKFLSFQPEGLTDNEDDQHGEFSVTEASMGEDDEVSFYIFNSNVVV